MSDECIFCKIIKGEVPNHTVYEDGDVLAFLDIFPHAKGHTVVIPKKHIERIEELDANSAGALLPVIKKITKKIDDVLHPDGYNIGWNDGKSAGQVVPHLHIHIMPRWENDGGGSMHSIINQPGKETVESISKLFKY
ncbi:MAG: hypothetical protein A2301_02500 [Candidatus Magasanikbacteria bacterium RIFOXYB2_FULL_40_13]|nr:MAG: hypothetical protein A2301_02500 [Candidatus Magasanikbacteria bacterium RIFOXYB2_FULL_40_13]